MDCRLEGYLLSARRRLEADAHQRVRSAEAALACAPCHALLGHIGRTPVPLGDKLLPEGLGLGLRACHAQLLAAEGRHALRHPPAPTERGDRDLDLDRRRVLLPRRQAEDDDAPLFVALELPPRPPLPLGLLHRLIEGQVVPAPGQGVPELPVLTQLHLQGRRAQVAPLALELLQQEGVILVVLTCSGLHIHEDIPEVLCALVRRVVEGLAQLLKSLLCVGYATAGQEPPQGRESADADLALRGEEAHLRVGEVGAHREHLCPGLAQALLLLYELGHVFELVAGGHLAVHQHGEDLVGQLHELLRPQDDAPDKVGVVVLQDPFGYHPEAKRQQWPLCRAAVLHERRLHFTPNLKGLEGILPESLCDQDWELRFAEDICLAMRSENEHRDKPLAIGPLMPRVVHRHREELLVNSQDGVVGHPPFVPTEVLLDKFFVLRPHLCSQLVLQGDVQPEVDFGLLAQLALQEAEELFQGGGWHLRLLLCGGPLLFRILLQ
mmetsp:Transcript_113404/g.315734  ORF Transcript_113404/g.315734 Transcript_113404/m.315734 type:complete len:494 (-) Transcript_113404:308-1789(-)